MRARGAFLFFVSASLTIGAGAVVGQSQAPARDVAVETVAQRMGTAIVSGLVVSDESPRQPLRRVTVSLVSADLRVPLSTVTDDAGRFTIAGVPAGNYGIVASKAAYVGAFYGSKQPGRGPGVPVAVRDGQQVSGISLAMTRGGVITGTLRLPGGRPAANMPVFVTGIETAAGERRLRLTGGRATTDDRGQYRVYGLPAGDYIVLAQPSGLLTGALAGAQDAPQTTASEVSWVQEVSRANRPAFAPAVSAPPPHGPTVNFATVYFPGTADPSQAHVVSLGRAEERGGMDFSMSLVATAKISGVISGPDGTPAPNVDVSIEAEHAALDLVRLLAPRAPVRSDQSGAFAIPAVPQGRYRLSAERTDVPTGGAGPNGVRPGVRAVAGAEAAVGAGRLWASRTITVDSRDVPDVALALEPGVTVSGRFVFDASTLTPPTADELERSRVTLLADQGGSLVGAAIGAKDNVAGQVAADGTFVIEGVVPGAYRIAVTMERLRVTPSAPGPGWSLRSAALDGADLADGVLRIAAGHNVAGLVATFTDRPSELAGALTDQANRAAPGYPVIVFSTNRAYWTPGSRRIAVARPSTDGSFQLIGLPAGEYYVAAVVDLDVTQVDDATFLEQLVPGAVTVTLRDGIKTEQKLQLARPN